MSNINTSTGLQESEGVVCYQHHHTHMELARAYIPMQGFNKLFCPEESLKRGTIFPDLYQPYKTYREQKQ